VIRATILALGLTAAALPAAADPVLTLPVDCDLGRTCFIQQYVDRDAGPDARDFTCAGLSYDGHKGTDFRVADFAALNAGIDIRAAAAGTVRGTRDGMTDGPLTDDRRTALADRDCGNGVVVDHGGGWETQYCHLRQGSLTVRTGDHVDQGTVLGQMGQSGLAEFPHLHLSVRHDGAVIDPFDPAATSICGQRSDPLWKTPVPYQPGGLLSIGFAGAIPDFTTIRAGTAHADTLPIDAAALVIWGFAFGTQAGDALRLTITGPTGQQVHTSTVRLDRAQAEAFRATGRRLGAEGWLGGVYAGQVEMMRDGSVIATMETSVRIGQ
jgi:hypothetical protein